MKCPKCHSENPDTSRFCGSCSALLDAEDQSSPSVTKTLATPVHGLAKGAMVAGKYRILEEIGRGGMGIVYKAEDTKLQRTVALKFLPPQWISDPEARERFIHEARAASALDHPNICTIYEIGETEDGRMFIAMAFYEGESLREKIKRESLKAEEAIDIAIQVAQGMANAHQAGIVHRDIKPANILITKAGVAKIVDFGLAKLAGQVRMTKEGTTVGTVAYMSPEQAKGEPVDQRTDIWSLGVVLYEMVSGRLPFKGDYEQSLIHSILNTDPEPLGKIRKDLPKGLESIVLKALEKDPKARYQGMGEVLEDLKAISEGLKPLRAKTSLFRGKVFGIRKIYAYAGLAILASIIVLLIALNVGRLRERMLGRTSAPRITSLAVLPVKNYSGDPSQEFLADGMTDDLIAGLGQIKALSVISRTSVMLYKDAKKSLPQIARELGGVDGIVEASVMRSAGRVRITAKLIDARKDRQLWAKPYERDMTEVQALQSELVQAIAGEIRVQLTPQESKRLKTTRPVDPEAHDATLKGKATLEYATREGQFRQAIELFQKAIDRDPTYAQAWAGLGEATWCLAGIGFEFVAPAEVRDKAIAAAERALELDETLADAHKARAVIALDAEWDVAKAKSHFERALELRPNYAAAHNLYGQMLGGGPLLRFDEARRHLDRARELDPLSPWNDINLVGWWMYQERPEKTLEEGERARRRNPTLWIIPWQIGFARLLLQQPSQAVPEFEAALEVNRPERPVAVLGPLGLAYGLAGRRADALKILAEMEQASQKRYISPSYLAVVYSGLGRMDEAFRLLDRALEQRTPTLIFRTTPYDPESVALRRDPHWKPFIDRLRRLVRLPPGTPDPYS
jgi:serine/threonine protein kinase/tetratricopeptide (TPR) repeat protein